MLTARHRAIDRSAERTAGKKLVLLGRELNRAGTAPPPSSTRPDEGQSTTICCG
jgi:hypothetical protein